ncbi:MAG: hypothetical protein SVX43_11995, partial [Cyanobacteriota bacterium]|nr:hypothetical protein [Cyanobacteriota bacterium]
MCRNFNIFLSPVKIDPFFFVKDPSTGNYRVRPREVIQTNLRERIAYATAVAEDCSKKSTKAGYDAAGMAIGTLDLKSLLEQLESRAQDNLSAEQMAEWAQTLRSEISAEVNVSRDGGDLLKTWDALFNRAGLQETEFITNWETHVRQASQGDMYSESNAHPHREVLTRSQIRIYQLTPEGILGYGERDRQGAESLFYDTHNGDINDASRYKRFLSYEGFQFASNSDSCVEPALKRFLWEHQQSNNLAGALHRLAYTDPDSLEAEGKGTATVDGSGQVGDYVLGEEFAHQTLKVSVAGDRITFLKDKQPVASFMQRGFLRDDDRSRASEKISELLALAKAMTKLEATDTTIVTALVARILEYSNPKNKFTFQSFTSLGTPQNGLLGGGTYT